MKLTRLKLISNFSIVFFQSPIFLEACIKASRGNTNRKRVNENFFLDYQVELPTLPEQQRLITRINKAKDCIGIVDKEITHQEIFLTKLKQAIFCRRRYKAS